MTRNMTQDSVRPDAALAKRAIEVLRAAQRRAARSPISTTRASKVVGEQRNR